MIRTRPVALTIFPPKLVIATGTPFCIFKHLDTGVYEHPINICVQLISLSRLLSDNLPYPLAKQIAAL
jgi:hypothetical protein